VANDMWMRSQKFCRGRGCRGREEIKGCPFGCGRAHSADASCGTCIAHTHTCIDAASGLWSKSLSHLKSSAFNSQNLRT